MIKAGALAGVPAFATDVLSWCASVSEAAFSLSTDRVMLDKLEMVIALTWESHFGRAAEHLNIA